MLGMFKCIALESLVSFLRFINITVAAATQLYILYV
jgi:hypothetical protein